MKRKLQNQTQNIDDDSSSSSGSKRMRQFRGILARNQEQEELNQQEINALLPGLPDHLAMLCLARVPSLTNLWGISSAWQNLLYTSHFFHSIRAQLGHHNLSWLYALIAQDHIDSEDSAADTSDSFLHSSRISFAWYAFDPLAFLWHKLPPMPPDIRFELSRPGFLGPYPHPIQCISTQTKLILVAGTRTSSSSSSPLPFGSKSVAVEPALDRPLVFDVAAATWSRGPRYAVPRRWCTCGTARGKVLLASGVGSEWDVHTARAAEVWDVAARGETWREVSRLASTKLSREATQAVDVGGRLHMVSARVGTVFDLETGGWAPMAPGMSRGWNGTCVVSHGRLLAVDDTAGRIRKYDKGTDSWAVVLDDERLKSLGNVVAAADGKICGSVDGTIRIVDLDGEKIKRFREVKIPVKGQVVSLQILSGMVIDLKAG